MQKLVKRPRQRRELGFSLINLLILVLALCNFFPLYWMLKSSVSLNHLINKTPPEWFPSTITFKHYQNLLRSTNVVRWTGNSILVADISVLLIVAAGTLAAYAFSKLRFRGRNALFILLISTLMLPKEVYIVPLFKVTQYLKIFGSFAAVILPNVATAFGVFLLRNFFDSVPDSMREAAKIDGATEFAILVQIFVPLAKAGIAALSILMFVQVWNDYLWQVLQLSQDQMKTLQLGVAALQIDNNPDYGLKMAGTSIAAAPLILLFLLFQKSFTKGITLGAEKG